MATEPGEAGHDAGERSTGAASTSQATGSLLLRHRVALHLPTLSYVPEYVTPAEEERLLREVRASQAKWVQLSGRRLQNHGGVVHAKGLIPAPMPSWLGQLNARLAADVAAELYGGKPPNHVLVNSYMPGEGIMAHEDGPAYVPGVAILSLGAPAILRFRRKHPDGGPATLAAPPVASLLLLPRSLVTFQHDAFTDCLHGIDEVTEELCDASVANLRHQGGQAGCGPQEPEAGAREAGQQAGQGASQGGPAVAGPEAAGGASSGPPPAVWQGVALVEGAVVPRGAERISLTVRRVAKVMPSILRPR